jgi:glycosyltransferase involved in cell wall biosynthesis
MIAMKIAIVLTGGLHPSGREQVVPAWLWLIRRFSAAHEVHAFTLRHLAEPTEYELLGATIHDLGRPNGRWAQWKALRRALVATGPFDVIHGYLGDPAGMLAAVAGRRLGMPSVVSCDSGEFTSIPTIGYGSQHSPQGRAVVALACRLATCVHVTTRFMETRAAPHASPVKRIPIGVDLEAISSPASRSDGPPWRLLQVASLNRVKDQSTLLAAVAMAHKRISIKLDLVGEDTLGGKMQREATAAGLTGSVTFHGFQPHDAISRFYRSAHMYVQSSLHEGGGVAVLEAAAARLPIVGTKVGYVSDFEPHAAIAVPPGDAHALADAIVKTLRDQIGRRTISTRARQFAEAHDTNWTAQQLMALYESLRVPQSA